MRNTQQGQMYLSNVIGSHTVPLNAKFELIQKLQELQTMEDQEYLTEEEVAQLKPEDITHYTSEIRDGKEYEFFGDLDAPILFQIEEEGKSTLCVRGWHTSALVSFGNYMLLRYPDKATNAELSGDVIMGVTDADLANWRFLLEQNNTSLSEAMSTDDETVYPNEYFDNELEERAEQFRSGGI